MNRWIRGTGVVSALSLGASLLAHVAGYESLDRLAAVAPRTPPPSSVVEFTLSPLPPPEHEEPPDETLPIPAPAVPVPVPPAPPEETPTPAVPTPPTPPAEEPQTSAMLPDPQMMRERTAVVQESDDPSVPPPDDARFLAAENRRVLEETIAEQRSVASDEAVSEPPDAERNDDARDPAVSEPNADETTNGDENPSPDDTEPVARVVTPRMPTPPVTPPTPAPAEATPSPPSPAVTPRAGERPRAPSEPTLETFTFTDEDGTYTVTAPRASASAADARTGTTARTGREPLRLRIDYGTLAAAVGEDELEAARAAARQRRTASTTGERRDERMAQFRFAAENFVGSVRTGNQTALNAAAAPYAVWLSSVHRRIHRHFAERFLERIASHSGAMANMQLYAEYEFVVDPHGQVLSIGRRHTSGQAVFDMGAFDAIMDAQPYPETPSEIRSGDGNVYVIWGFSRDPMYACHVSQSRPYILPNPPPLRPMPGVRVPGSPSGPGGTVIDDRLPVGDDPPRGAPLRGAPRLPTTP